MLEPTINQLASAKKIDEINLILDSDANQKPLADDQFKAKNNHKQDN
jgi:hypothetical protein